MWRTETRALPMRDWSVEKVVTCMFGIEHPGRGAFQKLQCWGDGASPGVLVDPGSGRIPNKHVVPKTEKYSPEADHLLKSKHLDFVSAIEVLKREDASTRILPHATPRYRACSCRSKRLDFAKTRAEVRLVALLN